MLFAGVVRDIQNMPAWASPIGITSGNDGYQISPKFNQVMSPAEASTIRNLHVQAQDCIGAGNNCTIWVDVLLGGVYNRVIWCTFAKPLNTCDSGSQSFALPPSTPIVLEFTGTLNAEPLGVAFSFEAD